MKNANSPFRVTLRIAGYSALLSMVICSYLFATSTTPQQYMMTAIIAILLMLLSLSIGFYFGMRKLYEKEDAQREVVRRSIHYPARAQFDQKIDAVDARVSRLYKKDGRYA
jgi:hypothetical protein